MFREVIQGLTVWSCVTGSGNLARTAGFGALATILASGALLHASPSGLLDEGTRALYRGDFVQASSLAGEYLKAHPQSAPALILLARAEMAQGKHESAYQTLMKASRLDPGNLDTLYYLAQVCRLLSQAEFQALYEMAPDSARVHQLLAESFRAQADVPKAIEEYEAALRANPQSVEVLDALGDLKRSQFKFEEALSYYARALEIQPRDYDSAYGTGACYLYLQQPERAIKPLRNAVAVDPKSAVARLALGDAQLRAGNAPEAITELQAAVALEPRMRQAYTLLARAYRKLGRNEEADQALKRSNELARMESQTRQGLLATSDLDAPPSAAAPGTSPAGAPPE
jgi:tetratricopeptide (TPR) repeat protein